MAQSFGRRLNVLDRHGDDGSTCTSSPSASISLLWMPPRVAASIMQPGQAPCRCDVDLLAIDLDQFDVAVVALQHRADRFEHLLDLADALEVGQLLGRRLRRFRRGRAAGGVEVFAGAVQRSAMTWRGCPRSFVAGRTAAAGLGVVGDLLDRVKAVGAHHVLDHHGVDGEALADQRAFLVVVAPDFAAVVGDRRLQRLAPHHRAVHLFRRQAVEVVGDVLVADLQRLVERLALDDLGQRRRRGDGRAAAEGLEMRVLNDLGFRVDFQHQPQRVAALDGADIADAVGLFQQAGVARVEEVFFDFFGVVPHGVRPSDRERLAAGARALAFGLSNLKPVWVSCRRSRRSRRRSSAWSPDRPAP